eukprot:TRINITY_DN1226_c0_g1_i1.p1 TRINITY_DN1226_c0_g1~~TRINITY_DN1226_c0_g1_i1.p1  ORF type:complete len:136 (-),score=3.21 TRINITY_DN1226_c0_g1_i1:1474-1881(-)
MSQGVSTKQERDRALELLTTLDDIPLHTVRDTNAESLKLRNTITVDPQGACQAVLEAARLRRPDLLEKLMVLGASPFSRDAVRIFIYHTSSFNGSSFSKVTPLLLESATGYGVWLFKRPPFICELTFLTGPWTAE